MPSLNSSLNMGQRALSMNQRAMHTSGHNIANQQTEGFSRQQVTTQSAPADPLGLGRGAEAQPTTRVFDHFIQKKILQDLVALCEPRKLSLTLDYNVRGGLHTEITVEYHR